MLTFSHRIRMIVQQFWLHSVVFLTGASILIIEVVATRILAPQFGGTIYTVSSVIGVILAALSLGYWRGGRIADDDPTTRRFFRIIIDGAASLALLIILMETLLPLFGAFLPGDYGPLIASASLFFLPAYLFGILSPFAIVLGHALFPTKPIGSLSGEIFFVSTVGSIAGSLSAGFILIPLFGIRAIILGITIFLALLGVVGSRYASPRDGIAPIVRVIIALTIAAGTLLLVHRAEAGRFLAVTDGAYGRIVVLDMEYDGRPTRAIVEDRVWNGARFLDGEDLVFDYTKALPTFRVATDSPRALFIGGAGYAMPIALRRLSPSATITVVEIEPQAEALARHYFRLTDEHRIRTITEDGRRFLAQDHTQYDLIVGDAYGSLYATPPHLVTREFFDLVRDRLTPGGIFFMNAIGSSETDSRSLLYSEVKTLRAVFSDVALFAIDDASDPGVQNFVLLARNVPPDTKTDWGAFMRTSNDHFLASLAEREVSLTGSFLARYDIYTDDYAPVERDSRSIMDAPRART